nr:FK506-binding protein 15-like [Aegilops tauschii subsp. strangulata]
MSRSGSQGKWVASPVTEEDITGLREARYLTAEIPHGLPAKAQTFNVKPKVVDGEHAECSDAMVSKLAKVTSPKGAFMETIKASLLAANAQAAEVSELKQKLKLADEEIVLINKRRDEAQDGAAEVETLRGELAQAKVQARVSNAVADKGAADLKAEQATRHQFEERISVVEQELKDTVRKYESLEKENKPKATELDKALQEAKDARSESRAAHEEIRQAGQIAADAFADLPKSAANATQFFQAQEGHATAKLFWSQFAAQERPAFLNDQMAQWAKLHKIY